MPLSKQQHLDPNRPSKRILSLDGGGIRGILTLEYLSVIENMLRKRSGRDDFRLCDYFDLIGGTSTGSIIAAGLTCGILADRLKQLYRDLGKTVFVSKIYRKGILAPKFPSEPVQKALDAQLGAETTLDDDRIRTGLMIMAKRLDTGSPWPLHNHPNARYAQQDGKLLLTQVVRASTAAPTYFEPQTIEIASRDGKVVKGAFVDGGVSRSMNLRCSCSCSRCSRGTDSGGRQARISCCSSHWAPERTRRHSRRKSSEGWWGEARCALAAIADERLRAAESLHAAVADTLRYAMADRS
jgi:predicted patatin/cPLA2 family phospholipase